MRSIGQYIHEYLFAYLLCICSFLISNVTHGQGTIQRQVKISNANGNVIILQTDTPSTSYTLNLPNNPTPSSTVASLLYGIGNNNLTWSSTLGADSGSVLQLTRVGSRLVPGWRSMSTTGFVNNGEPILTFAADNGSLTNNRVFSVGSGLSVTNSGIDNGSLVIGNTGVLKLTAGSGISVSDTTGNIVITSNGWLLTGNTSTTPWNGTTGNLLGTIDNQDLVLGTGATASSREKLRISSATGNLLLSRPGAQFQLQGTGTGVTTFQAGAQGTTNINYILPTSLPSVNGQALTASTAGVLSWVTVSGGGGAGWALTGNAGTTAGTNFIGTTDNVDWVVKTNNTERLRVLSTGDIGVNTTTPNTNLDVNGDFALREYNYTTAIPTSLNNANFDGASNNIAFVRLASAAAPFNITGLVGGLNGKMMSIYNATSQSMTIVNQSASSTAANRIITGTSANIPLPAGGTVNFLYSAQDSRWIVRSISGTAGWLYTGNSGLVDGTSNFHGTLDSIPIRFVAGNNGPRQRMVLDPRGNLLFGANSASTTFASGSNGKLAFGDSLNTLRLNSLPTYGARVFNMIDPNAVMRVWRFNTNAGGTDPAVELIGGTSDLEMDVGNQKWDFYSTGTPGVPLSGTKSQGEHFAIRRRTAGNDSVYMAVFAGSGVRIGTDTLGIARYTPYKLAVLSEDQNTSGVMDLAVLEHLAQGTPSNGLGTGLLFKGETTVNDTTRDMARVASVWTNVTDASRTSALTFSTVDNAGPLTERMRVTSNGYMGLNVSNPQTRLDINGAYATREKTITLSNGRNDNIAIGDASFVRVVGPTSAFSISGIANGTNGKRVRIANMTGYDWTVMDSSSFSTLGNRIETNTNSDIIVSGPVPILDMIYDSVSNQWLLGTLNANQVIGAVGSIIYKYKTADESVTSSATIQDDDHLSFNVNANETWELTGEIQADNSANNVDIKVAFQLPTGATMRIYTTGIQDAGGNAIQGNGLLTVSNTSKTIQINGAVSTLMTFRGIFVTGSNAGTVKFRWAQGTSNNSTTTVRSYSYMKLIRVK